MKFPDVSRLGSVTVPDAGRFIVLLVREDLTPGEAAGVLRGKIARAKHPLDAYDAGIEDVIDACRAALSATPVRPDLTAAVRGVRAVIGEDCWCGYVNEDRTVHDADCLAVRAALRAEQVEPESHPFHDEWSFQRSMSKGNPQAGKPIAPDQPCFDCGVPFRDHARVLPGYLSFRAEQVERPDRDWAEWIVRTSAVDDTRHPMIYDHACPLCVPNGPLADQSFRCVPHQAVAALSDQASERRTG